LDQNDFVTGVINFFRNFLLIGFNIIFLALLVTVIIINYIEDKILKRVA